MKNSMQTAFPAVPLKILIVEDNPGDLLLLKERIAMSGLASSEISIADSIASAYDHLQKNSFDIVFLDLFLPDSTARNSFEQLKELMINSVVIILSGLSDIHTARETIANGAQDFLAKGEFDEKLLEKTVLYSLERKEAQERISSLHQKAATEATIKDQEKKRHQLGVELHENINQILATANLYLDFAMPANPEKKEILLKSKEFIALALVEIRKLSHTLLTPELEEFGLIMALNELVFSLSVTRVPSIEKRWEVFDEEILSREHKLTIYRIAQEQLNNIAKHAYAKNVLISLCLSDDVESIELFIKDDGIGFDQSEKRNGVGLRNISDRAGLFGGQMKINSNPGNGCELKVIFPCKLPIYQNQS